MPNRNSNKTSRSQGLGIDLAKPFFANKNLLNRYAEQLLNLTNHLALVADPLDLNSCRKLSQTLTTVAKENSGNQISFKTANTIKIGLRAARKLNDACNTAEQKFPEASLLAIERNLNSVAFSDSPEKLKILFSALLLNRIIDALNAQTLNSKKWNLETEIQGIKIRIREDDEYRMDFEYKGQTFSNHFPVRSFYFDSDSHLAVADCMQRIIEKNIAEIFESSKLESAVKELAVGQEDRIRD